MLACDKTLTIVQRIYNQEKDIDEYISTVINNCSWFSKVKIELQDKGVRSSDLVTIRVPEEELPHGILIANGDYIINGILGERTINKHSDMAGIDYVTVVSVGDNRRGRLRHWAVIGKR